MAEEKKENNKKSVKNKSNDECIKKAGYDINTEIKKIEKYFNRK